MIFSEANINLFQFYKEMRAKYIRSIYRYERGRIPTRVIDDMNLLWTGDHYFLIREGKIEGDRKTLLVNREHLLLERGNKHGDNEMMSLALATIHPVHASSTNVNSSTCLHTNKSQGLVEEFKGRRWNMKLVKELIAYAENKDRQFFENETEGAEAFDRASDRAEIAVDIVEATGIRIVKPDVVNHVEFPSDEFYLIHGSSSTFKPLSKGGVSVVIRQTLTYKQFSSLMSVLAGFQTEETE